MSVRSSPTKRHSLSAIVGTACNPSYAARFKTKIVYEAYPESQEEVDAILRQFLWTYRGARVIYDP